jgi:hypothetical protein
MDALVRHEKEDHREDVVKALMGIDMAGCCLQHRRAVHAADDLEALQVPDAVLDSDAPRRVLYVVLLDVFGHADSCENKWK